jgi:oligogalacturonide lyase
LAVKYQSSARVERHGSIEVSAVGVRVPAEWRTSRDPATGVEMRQLTNHRGNSYHLYFTNPGWYRGGRSLLFGSDRANRTNLFGVDLGTGEITQLTDFETPPPPAGRSFQGASVNPRRDEAYFWHDRDLVALDLATLEQRRLARAPEGMQPGNTSVTADGAWVCSSFREDLSGRIEIDLAHGYVGFHEVWEARPLCQVVRVNTATGAMEVVLEDRVWIGHVNTSPTRAAILTFCHEGPWQRVDQRIWGLDLESGRTWPLRPQRPGERVGHEYWFQDGDHVGYQGWDTGGRHFFGRVRYDDGEREEAPFPHGSMHFHSNDLGLIAGDGSAGRPQLLLWRHRAGRFDGPRLVLTHRSSFHCQEVHVHPRFSPDGRQVVFTSDARGYGNVYAIDVPEFDGLPAAEAPPG